MVNSYKIFDCKFYDIPKEEIRVEDIIVCKSEMFRPDICNDWHVIKIIFKKNSPHIQLKGYFYEKDMAILFAKALTNQKQLEEMEYE